MNKLMIIGNCTKDPEMRTTPTGKNVCTFTLAVNRRKKVEGQPDADFFRVTAWDALGENCGKYLQKGKKAAVVGAISVHPFTSKDGKAGASMEVVASEVEFLSGRDDIDRESGMQKVEVEEMPY